MALNKKFFSTIIMVTVMMAISCSDDDPKKTTCNIITVQFSQGTSDTRNISYNAEGKVSSITYGTYHRNFQYTGNMVIMNQTDDGNFSQKVTYTLNDDGLVLNKKVEKNPTGTIWENSNFEYDGTELQKIVTTFSGSSTTDVETYTWSNGNPIKSVNNGNTTLLEYYTDKPAKDGDYLHLVQLINFGVWYLKSKNPLKSSQGNSSLVTFEYDYGSDGKISSIIMNTGSPQPVIVNYQYECN